MHIDIVPNRGGAPTVLLRKSYRENGKTKKLIVANLSELAPEQIEQMRAVLRGERLLPAAQAIEIVRALPHGMAEITSPDYPGERLGCARIRCWPRSAHASAAPWRRPQRRR
jgi:hypothetical protein